MWHRLCLFMWHPNSHVSAVFGQSGYRRVSFWSFWDRVGVARPSPWDRDACAIARGAGSRSGGGPLLRPRERAAAPPFRRHSPSRSTLKYRKKGVLTSARSLGPKNPTVASSTTANSQWQSEIVPASRVIEQSRHCMWSTSAAGSERHSDTSSGTKLSPPARASSASASSVARRRIFVAFQSPPAWRSRERS